MKNYYEEDLRRTWRKKKYT